MLKKLCLSLILLCMTLACTACSNNTESKEISLITKKSFYMADRETPLKYTEWEYDEDGRILSEKYTSVASPTDSYRISYIYDEKGYPIVLNISTGSRLFFDWDDNGHITMDYTLQDDSFLNSFKVYENSGKTLDRNWFNSRIDEKSYRSIRYYDENGYDIRQVSFPEEDMTILNYEKSYDSAGNLVSDINYSYYDYYVSNPNPPGKFSYHLEYEYDNRGNLIKKTGYDEEGNIINYTVEEYDSRNNPVSIRIYDSYGSYINETLEEGRYGLSSETCYDNSYNWKGQLIYVEKTAVLPANHSITGEEYSYDGYGNLIAEQTYFILNSEKRPKSRMEYIYDAEGKLLEGRFINPDGTYSVNSYNSFGQLVKDISYDSDGNMFSGWEYEYMTLELKDKEIIRRNEFLQNRVDMQ